ncbi:helix-turn-helix domain-containing protein [Rhodoblastus acidophilus]|uniref:Helix-turn-helix domain-containing protein n=2 Tax=Candidatus Rhodoblastus alkanivorans TaxID=2954117 RepID=A0ABS9ZBD3_9HYPH|nr:helix-turn-helix domain-containing protein [Candidatus Rhodoblastus alkanivorans]MDI4643203.1 helix-turn-helix domain-containing protein [Rhodoblastus acidophilus]
MQPEQMRAARAALNWSLDRLAEASGVHRNTLSNFETRKYDGDPEKVAAVARALRAAGVIFIKENGEAAGVRLRRFRQGDRVRFRPETRVRFDYGIGADEVGTVIAVEPHPPATGPTYRVQVQFERALVPFEFRFEYELVQAGPLSLESFIESSGMAMIPLSHFVPNPSLDSEPHLETDLSKLPQELRSQIIIPSADDKLRNTVEERGFITSEANPSLILMWRQFPDGVLYTGPLG